MAALEAACSWSESATASDVTDRWRVPSSWCQGTLPFFQDWPWPGVFAALNDDVRLEAHAWRVVTRAEANLATRQATRQTHLGWHEVQPST